MKEDYKNFVDTMLSKCEAIKLHTNNAVSLKSKLIGVFKGTDDGLMTNYKFLGTKINTK